MSVAAPKDTGKSDAVLLRGAKAHMAESVAQRTDEWPIKGWRVHLPLIGSLIGMFVLVFLVLWLGTWQAFVIGYVFLYTIVSAFAVLPTYLLMKRLAAHVRRETMLRRGAIEYLRATSSAGGTSSRIDAEISNLESIERDVANTEKVPRTLYTAFGALPLAGIFVTIYYLRKLETLPLSHQHRWAAFVQQVSSAGAKLGLSTGIKAPASGGKDRFLPFAVVTILFPPFLVVWYHLLLKESAAHLRSQASDEDAVLQLLS